MKNEYSPSNWKNKLTFVSTLLDRKEHWKITYYQIWLINLRYTIFFGNAFLPFLYLILEFLPYSAIFLCSPRKYYNSFLFGHVLLNSLWRHFSNYWPWLIFKNSLHEQKYVHTHESDNIAMLLSKQYLGRQVNTTLQVS